MAKINMNKVAKEVAAKEGGVQSVSIAQIKEVLRLGIDVLKGFKVSQVVELLERP